MFLLSVGCWALFVMYVHKGVFFYQRWLFCTFLEVFNLYTDLILWPVVDGRMRIRRVCNVLLSGWVGAQTSGGVATSACAAVAAWRGVSGVWNKQAQINDSISLRLSWLRNAGAEHRLPVPFVQHLAGWEANRRPPCGSVYAVTVCV